MKGDFSRGHTPDRKRGEKYRRVLLQEGRLLLDSDIAASVDAYDRLLRDLAGDVGCKMGSPNLGYIVTPGPLFAFFETLDDVSNLPASGAAFLAYRDHAVKYLERYPALYLGSTAAAGTVHVTARMTLSTDTFPTLRIWAQIPTGAQLFVAVEGVVAAVAPGLGTGSFDAYDIDVLAILGPGASYTELDVGFTTSGAANEAWLGLIEGVQEAGAEPAFWFTAGRFYMDGLEVEHGPSDGTYPETTFPAAAGFDAFINSFASDTYLVAYLEGWERQITTVEDAGILEEALGGSLDTTLRTQALGQVKLALVSTGGIVDVTQIGDLAEEAFETIDRGTATLDVTTTPSGSDPDPCAIPAAGGYTGGENRFYRFEVHTAGDVGTALLKWSKNNGADLCSVTVDDAANGLVTLRGTATIEDGDLVELLYEATDLGDNGSAAIDLVTVDFTPADRQTGTLYYVETTSTTSQVQLLDLTTKAPVSIAAVASKAGLKVRRWSGLCDTSEGGGTSSFDLGDGITITLGGASFRPGDYWQYEARRNKDNANGTWQSSPHGPERLFTPLALLEFDFDTSPLTLHRWYEHQFSALCDLEADDIAYDGTKVGTDADTVQEAIDELYTLVDEGGCCTAFLEPAPALTDDALRIQALVDDLPTGGTICLKSGVYTFSTAVKVQGKTVTIKGCPDAVIVCSGNAIDGFQVMGPTDTLSAAGELTLSDLVIHATSVAGPIVHVTYPSGSSSYTALTIRSCALVHTGLGKYGLQIGDGAPLTVDPFSAVPFSSSGIEVSLPLPALDLQETIVVAPWAAVIDQVWGLRLDRCVLVGEAGGISAAVLGRGEMRGSTVSMMLNDTVRSSITSVPSANLNVAIQAIVETALDYSNIAQPTAGIGLVVQAAFLLTTEDNVVIANVAQYIGTISMFRATNDVFMGVALGSRIDELKDSCITGAYLLADEGIALHLPWDVRDSTISGSRIRGACGVVLGADTALGSLPSAVYGYPGFHDVHISSNLIEAYGFETGPAFGVGILFGGAQAAAGGPPATDYGTWSRIVVDHNTVDGRSESVGIAALLVEQSILQGKANNGFNFNFDGPLSFRIEDNLVTHARSGIVFHGPGFEVRRNTVTGNVEQDTFVSPISRVGIHAWEAYATLVEDNLVQFDEVGLGGNIERTTGIELGTGTLYPGSSDGRFVKNTVRSNAAIIPFVVKGVGGETGNYYNLWLQDNAFQGDECEFSGVNRLTLLGNRFVGGFKVDACWDGVVARNTVTYGRQNGLANALMTSCSSTWQVQNNRVDGDMQVLPLVDYASGGGPPGAKYWSHYLMENAPWLAELVPVKAPDSPKPQKKPPQGEPQVDVSDLPQGVIASPSHASAPVIKVRRVRYLEGAEAKMVALPMASAKEKGATSALEVAIDVLRKKIAELLKDLQKAGLTIGNEYSFDAQVEDNWVNGVLLVGHVFPGTPPAGGVDPSFYPQAYPSQYTSVQVLGNRAGYFLNVNQYSPNTLSCDNATYQYFGIGSAFAGPINTHNLDLG